MNMNSKQSVSSEEYCNLDNRVASLLQHRWPNLLSQPML